MDVLIYVLGGVVSLGAAFCALIFYNTWREKRKQSQMARDHAWRVWIGRVRARLENIEGESTALILDREGEWFHGLWEKKFSPNAATEKWLADRETSFHESF